MKESKKHRLAREKAIMERVQGKIARAKEKVLEDKAKRSKPRTGRAKARANRTKLLVSIVNQKDDAHLKEVLDEFSIALSVTFAGRGTARSQVLDYLGIGETEKAVVFSLFPESDEEAILREIRTQMSLYLVGRGISFTVPLSSVSEIVANGLASAAATKTVDRSKIMTDANRKFDLIVAIVNSNFTDEAMEAARSAGAAGGTIIRARTLSNAKAEQFIGITLAQEQEVLLILTRRESKTEIMHALSERVGLKSEAGGVIFSLPVDKTAGIGAETGEEEPAKKAKAKAEKEETAKKAESAPKEETSAAAEPTEQNGQKEQTGVIPEEQGTANE